MASSGSWVKLHKMMCLGILLGLTLVNFVSSGNLQTMAVDDTLNLAVLIPWTGNWDIGERIGSAPVLAIQEINDRNILKDYTIEWEWRDSKCKSTTGVAAAVDLWNVTTDLDGFIGGGCSEVCEPVALMAAAFNLPFISFGCTGNELSNKVTYPTFSRTVASWAQLATMVDVLTERMTWTTRIGIVAGTAHIMQSTAEIMRIELEKETEEGHTQKSVLTYTIEGQGGNLKSAISNVKTSVHIVILLLYPPEITAFLVEAGEQGLRNGEYIFITVDTELDESRYEELGTVYESVIALNLMEQTGTAWDTFTSNIVTSFSHSSFTGYDHLQPTDHISHVDLHAGLLHDAILAWAYGVNRTLDTDLSKIDDGRAITNNIINMTFTGVSGTVAIDANGDRKMEYIVTIIQNYSFIDIFHYEKSRHILTKQYKPADPDDWSDINWGGGKATPPTGRPECGWEKELCKGRKLARLIRILVTLVVVVVLAAAAYFIYRRLRFYKELHAVDKWKVTAAEVRESKIGKQLAGSRANMRTITMMALDRAQEHHYCDVAILKGILCAVKRLNRQNVNYSDYRIQLEMKQMREMCHNNVNAFLAAVCEFPNVCICMQYAAKGSLQDVLLNESVELSWDFKLSMASDIAKGMEYIHRSPFGSHGHLNSNNCVVDSRWVCKVTDYGCALFKKGHTKEITAERVHTDRLWVAPELLRVQEAEVPVYGTKEGDVYGYGIILQEIVNKDIAYGVERETTMPEHIVKMVTAGHVPPFRPELSCDGCSYEWQALIQMSWSEDPSMRPNFKQILHSLQDINGGKPMNLTDNMIMMLELHSEHLEELLAAKNQEAQVEKRRVENFLYSTLPRPIAECLLAGESVSAKAYESVSVYYGLITDFTTIVNSHSPHQVTDLVNRLQGLLDNCMTDASVVKIGSRGDTELMVSGCPEEAVHHAKEMTSFALRVLTAMQDFDTQLQLCIGIHTGPCVAGIVGLRMPRYCIFGEPVFVATDLAAGSEPFRVRVSQETRDALGDVEFDFIPAPSLNRTGKTKMASYYVCNEQPLPI